MLRRIVGNLNKLFPRALPGSAVPARPIVDYNKKTLCNREVTVRNTQNDFDKS